VIGLSTLSIREQKKEGKEQRKYGLEILARGEENDARLLADLAHQKRG
jgi:hypothetical protein